MKYYSDVTKKVYDTADELEKAEAEVKKLEEEKEAKLATISKEKKAFATEIENADKELDEAYKQLDVAREKAKQLQKEHLKQLENILHPAEEAVKTAQNKKYEAVKAFNDKFGVFTTTYTGAKAADELNRTLKYFDEVFHNFFF